jgi:hypothetical protein
MPMSSGLTSSLSEFTKRSEFAKSPLAGASADQPAAQPAGRRSLMTRTRASLRVLASSALVRYLIVFSAGIAATLAWQVYAGPARKAAAGWSPRLAWLAPAASPRGVSADRIKATSLALAAVHQSVDKLATEVVRLETQAGSVEASTPPPSRRGSRRQ